MPNAILSVYDKSGLVELAGSLVDLGWKLIATGDTSRLLHQNQIPVTHIADYTGAPEILGGRVKTLHPAIHGGLLARPTRADHAELLEFGWDYIDLVVVNPYPFEETIAKPGVREEEAIENIDIGGVTLIRAAAKNHARVTLLCDPTDYPIVLAELKSEGVTKETRQRLAVKGFALSARYDAAITAFLGGQETKIRDQPTEPYSLKLYPVASLRYGENPHQSATLYGYEPGSSPLGGKFLQGKELSYNNMLDLDSAWRAAISFERPTVCIGKHLSPCGLACADKPAKAFELALACDPISAFGGVIATNKPFDLEIAQRLGDLFVECIVAPGFSEGALQILVKRRNLRLISMTDTKVNPPFEFRSINQGVLRQSVDLGDPPEATWRVTTMRQPTGGEWQALRFAWKACQHVKSNAIVFARGEATVGIGGGQPNRVDSVRIAAQKAGERSRGAVMASDAFFPFTDSIEEAAKAGITAIVSPGGSLRDPKTIATAEQYKIAMVFTHVRHFRH